MGDGHADVLEFSDLSVNPSSQIVPGVADGTLRVPVSASTFSAHLVHPRIGTAIFGLPVAYETDPYQFFSPFHSSPNVA